MNGSASRDTTVVVAGAGGQLGMELRASAPPEWRLALLAHTDLDITDAAAVRSVLTTLRPDVVINAAAYTAVDRAEDEPELATAVNADGAGHLATVARSLGARFIHISTDFVFDGSRAAPYPPSASPRPLGAYGRSKLAGESQVTEGSGHTATIIRTSWLYSAHGKNFVKTMLRLMRERGSVEVVVDQVGTPTWAGGLAAVIWAVAARSDMAGVWHWSDAGVASWYDFAVAVRDEGCRVGLIDRPVTVVPITTEEYPGQAQRPAFSALDCTATRRHLGIAARHWSESLRDMLVECHGMAGSGGATVAAR